MAMHRVRRSHAILGTLAAAGIVAGCSLEPYCPPTTGGPLNRLRLVGSWRLDSLGQDRLPVPFAAKPVNRSLMIPGKTFLTFDALGNLKYIGTLGRSETTALWEIDMQFGLACFGLTSGQGSLGPVLIFNVRSSVTETPDGSVTVQMSWSQREANGNVGRDVTLVLERMRSGATTEQATAVMSLTESDLADPAPPQTHLIGEVLLERINPLIHEQQGDITPIGHIQARMGPAAPYNDSLIFNTGQAFDLTAFETYGPNQPTLKYYWHVVREQADPNTGNVAEQSELTPPDGLISSFIASEAGTYYVTLFVTDGVLWRSTSIMGRPSEPTYYVRVQ
jgi:hypothetical protein